MLRQSLPPLYEQSSLDDMIGYFQLNYYDVISTSGAQAKERLKALWHADEHNLLHTFYQLCEAVLEKVYGYIHDFETQVIPYAKELNEKSNSGHNCAHCSGKCDMGHQALLMQLYHGHQQLQNSLHNLKMGALPLYSNLEYPVLYKLLRDDLHFIHSKIHDLIYLEEAVLIPKLLESQKKINAHYN
jgi:hypothetical protein